MKREVDGEQGRISRSGLADKGLEREVLSLSKKLGQAVSSYTCSQVARVVTSLASVKKCESETVRTEAERGDAVRTATSPKTAPLCMVQSFTPSNVLTCVHSWS